MCRARFDENMTVQRKFIDPNFKAQKEERKIQHSNSDPFYQGQVPETNTTPKIHKGESEIAQEIVPSSDKGP